MLDRFIDILIQKRKQFAIFALVLLLGMGFFIEIPTIDGRLAGFNIENTDQYQNRVAIENEFGVADRIYIKVIPEAEEKAITVFESLEKIEERIEDAYPDSRCQSLHHSGKLLGVGENSKRTISEVTHKAADTPIVKEIIAGDSLGFLFLVLIDTTKSIDLEPLDAIEGESHAGISELKVISGFHVERAISDSLRHDMLMLSAIIVLFFVAFLLYTFRSITALIFALVSIGVCIYPALFLFSILDLPINLVTVLVIPVLLVLSLADVVHLLTGMSSCDESMSYEQKLKKSYHKYLLPSFLTSVTSAIAFISFLFNDSPNIQNFGKITGIAVILEFFLTFFIASFLLKYVKTKPIQAHGVSRLSSFMGSKKKVITFILIPVFIASIFFLPYLRFETDLNAFIPKNSKFHSDYMELMEDFDSSLKMEGLVRLRDKNGDQKELEKIVAEMHDELEEIPSVEKASSSKSLEDLKSGFGLASQFIRFPTKTNPYINHDKTSHRINLIISDADSLESAQASFYELFKKHNDKFELLVYSKGLLIQEINKNVASSLLYSMLFSVILIVLLIWAMTKSLINTLIAVFANMIPLSTIVLIFYFFDLDLNILTSITSVVCVGLIVDDTIHVLYRNLVLKDDLKELGFGILTTTIILFGGFAAFGLSSFEPSQIFGVVSAVIFLITVISDLSVLPYFLSLRKKNQHTPNT